MSWEEDVARRRWAYFLARRREFENAGKPPGHMHDAQAASACTHGSTQTHPPPAKHPVHAHEQKSESGISGDGEEKAAASCAAVNRWLAGIGDPELSWGDGPVLQNLLSPTHPVPQLKTAESLQENGREKECPFDKKGVPKEEDPLVHAYLCESGDCHVMCTQLKRLIWHLLTCLEREQGRVCDTCAWTEHLFAAHARICNADDCPLPCCRRSTG